MDLSRFNSAANEPTTLPLPFPTSPRSLMGELPEGAANEPPSSALRGSAPPRDPVFQWQPAWRGQDARQERERLFDTLGAQWREERRRRYLEAMLGSEPEHALPYRPYGDPTSRGVAG